MGFGSDTTMCSLLACYSAKKRSKECGNSIGLEFMDPAGPAVLMLTHMVFQPNAHRNKFIKRMGKSFAANSLAMSSLKPWRKAPQSTVSSLPVSSGRSIHGVICSTLFSLLDDEYAISAESELVLFTKTHLNLFINSIG